MKKIAFVLYVGCVLAFSAFARAEVYMPFSKLSQNQAPVTIEHVSVDRANLELFLSGFLPNPCTAEPTATLAQAYEEPNTLVLQLVSPYNPGVCITKTSDFNEVVSLPALAQHSQLYLDSKAIYTIKTVGYEFELQVLGSDLMRVPGFVNY